MATKTSNTHIRGKIKGGSNEPDSKPPSDRLTPCYECLQHKRAKCDHKVPCSCCVSHGRRCTYFPKAPTFIIAIAKSAVASSSIKAIAESIQVSEDGCTSCGEKVSAAFYKEGSNIYCDPCVKESRDLLDPIVVQDPSIYNKTDQKSDVSVGSGGAPGILHKRLIAELALVDPKSLMRLCGCCFEPMKTTHLLNREFSICSKDICRWKNWLNKPVDIPTPPNDEHFCTISIDNGATNIVKMVVPTKRDDESFKWGSADLNEKTAFFNKYKDSTDKLIWKMAYATNYFFLFELTPDENIGWLPACMEYFKYEFHIKIDDQDIYPIELATEAACYHLILQESTAGHILGVDEIKYRHLLDDSLTKLRVWFKARLLRTLWKRGANNRQVKLVTAELMAGMVTVYFAEEMDRLSYFIDVQHAAIKSLSIATSFQFSSLWVRRMEAQVFWAAFELIQQHIIFETFALNIHNTLWLPLYEKGCCVWSELKSGENSSYCLTDLGYQGFMWFFQAWRDIMYKSGKCAGGPFCSVYSLVEEKDSLMKGFKIKCAEIYHWIQENKHQPILDAGPVHSSELQFHSFVFLNTIEWIIGFFGEAVAFDEKELRRIVKSLKRVSTNGRTTFAVVLTSIIMYIIIVKGLHHGDIEEDCRSIIDHYQKGISVKSMMAAFQFKGFKFS